MSNGISAISCAIASSRRKIGASDGVILRRDPFPNGLKTLSSHHQIFPPAPRYVMNASKSVPIAIWWFIWFSIIVALVTIHAVLAPETGGNSTGAQRYLPIGPLVFSTLIRWFVLPRFSERRRAFPLFIAGLAMAEGTGLLGLFLVPGMETTYLVLSLMGIAQYIPVFVAKLDS
jgi:hypothetical protein